VDGFNTRRDGFKSRLGGFNIGYGFKKIMADDFDIRRDGLKKSMYE